MTLLFFWFMCGVIAGMIGSKKGEGCLAFILGLVLGPFGIIIAILSNGNQFDCPYCKAKVHKDAIVCPHCRRAYKL